MSKSRVHSLTDVTLRALSPINFVLAINLTSSTPTFGETDIPHSCGISAVNPGQLGIKILGRVSPLPEMSPPLNYQRF